MHDLSELQQAFQDYLLSQHPRMQTAVMETANVSASTRLNIYHEAYYLRLLEALNEDYPVLQHLLGDTAFTELGRHYIDAYPSSFRSVRWFGKELPAFIQNIHPQQPWLSEMAAFEWLLTEAFDAADASIISVDEILKIPADEWPAIQFDLHPSLRTLMLQWNVVAIWNSYQEKTNLPTPQQADDSLPWLIWRKEYDIHFRSLSKEETGVLHAMQTGYSFGEICEILCEWIDEDQVLIQAATLLKQFLMDGLITDIIFV